MIKRIPEYAWEGDSSDLLRRLGAPTRAKQMGWERCLWFGLGAALALSIASFSTPAENRTGLEVVRTSGDRVIWIDQSAGRAGACQIERDRVRCLRTDWISGPLEFE